MLNKFIINSWLSLLLVLLLLALTGLQSSFAFDQPWDQGHDTTRNQVPENPGPPDDPLSCGNKAQGSPVYVATGHFIWRETDVILMGQPSLSVNRTFNSHDPRVGSFGNGWSSNCEPLMNKVTDTEGKVSYVYVAANGKRYIYTQLGDGTFSTPEGQYTTLAVNNDVVTLTAQSGSFMTFNPAGRISQWTDSNGVTRNYGYNSQEQLNKIAGGVNSITFTYNSNGQVANIQDHADRVWSYDYDIDGNLSNVTDPMGGIRTFTYQAYTDAADDHTYYQLVQVDDASGKKVVTVSYNENRVAGYSGMGDNYTYTYDVVNKTVRKRDSGGRNNSFVYNDDQIIVQKTDPLNNVTKFEYDENGNVTKVTDALGLDWLSTYDTQGRKLTGTTPLGYTQKWEYSGANPKPIKITTPEGNSTNITYDDKLNPTSITDAKGNTVALVYNSKGNIISVTDARGKQSNLAYNDLGLPVEVTDANGNKTRFTYDNLGRRITSTDAKNRTTSTEYDALDRVSSTTNALGHITQYSYDAMGRLLSLTDPVSNVTSYEYDTVGRQSKETRPDGGITIYTYDSRINLLNQINRHDGKRITLTYDRARQLTRSRVGTNSINYSYNARGDRTSISNTTSGISYIYDNDGNLLNENQNGIQIDRAYNKDGALTQLKYLDQMISYNRDAINGLLSLTDGTDTFKFDYDTNNVLTSISLPNGLNESYFYDDIYNLTKIVTGSTTLDYTHDQTSLISSKTRDGDREGYTYDEIARLTQAGVEGFNYDVAGNDLNNASQYESTTNRLSENAEYTFTYDVAGNLTQKIRKDGAETKDYTFNDRNQLLKVVTKNEANEIIRTLEFTYDPHGRRYSKSVDGVNNRYVYDRSDIITTFDAASSPRLNIVHSEVIDTPLSISSDSSTFLYHRDHLGSIVSLTDASGNAVENYYYGSYGDVNKAESVNTSNPYAYTGREMDAQDLYYYRARYFDPEMRRFISEDPIGLGSGDYNLYRYVYNNPILNTDPSGLYAVVDDLTAIGVGAIFGVASQGFGDLLAWELGGWEDYVASGIGGAAAGETFLYAGPVAAGIVGSIVSNTTKQGLKNITGRQCGFNYTSLAVDASIGGITGLIPINVAGVTSGRGSMNAVYKQMITKFSKGQISRVKSKTALKMLVAKSVDPGAGIVSDELINQYVKPLIPGYSATPSCGCRIR